MINIKNISYRFLNKEEFARQDLIDIFKENGGSIPVPENAIVLIAEDENNKLVGFQVGQLLLHLEPTWVAPEYRRSNLFYTMLTKLIKSYEQFNGLQMFAFSPQDKFDKVLKRLKFVELDYKIFMKVVK